MIVIRIRCHPSRLVPFPFRSTSLQHTDLYIRAVKVRDEVSSDEATSMLSRCEDLVSLARTGYVKEEMDLDDFNEYFY